MYKFYEKREVLFSVLWIISYCAVMSALKGTYGYASVYMLAGLAVFTILIVAFVKKGNLCEKYGLSGGPKDAKKYLYFIPMFILATGNLWDGVAPSYDDTALIIATASMILVGFVEELVFRGFLFKAMLGSGKASVAIVVSTLTFGIGHIVNLFAGQASLETLLQVVFAISWGFILTLVFYKSGNLWPCIIAHAMIDAFSLYGADSKNGDYIYIAATVIVAIIYCVYLNGLKTKEEKGI